MRKLNFILIILYIFSLVADFIIVNRANRVVQGDSFIITGFWSVMFLLLLFVSAKNIKASVGRVGLLVLFFSLAFRYIGGGILF
jgi:hypothetical protein